MPGVVVGVRREQSAASALRWGSAEAMARGLELRLVHAWDEPLDLTIDLAAGTLPGQHVAATSCAVHGRAAQVLLDELPDLLVLGASRVAPHVSHLARQCLHHTACPVVVVPDRPFGSTGRIVVGVTGSAGSAAALRWAAEAARLHAFTLVGVHAWQVPRGTPGMLTRPRKAIAIEQVIADRWLEHWVERATGTRSVERRAVRGTPFEVLHEASVDADLLVLGGCGHSRWQRGGVGHDLLAASACPVAIVPAGVPAKARS